MAYRLPIFALAVVPLSVLAALAQQPQIAPATAVETAASNPPGQDDPQALVHRAVEAIRSYQTIQARSRFRADLYTFSMIGAGTYSQGPVRDRRWRSEWKLQLGDTSMSTQQIADGRYLWTVRQIDPQPTFHRVELRKAAEALDARSASPAAVTRLLGVGGMPRLVESLDRSFDFTSALPTEWSGIGVWAVRGDWKPAAAAALLPEQADAINAGEPPNMAKAPDYVPDHVVVFLGQQNLFPYRIEYRRSTSGSAGKSLLVLEFLDVRLNAPIEPQTFTFEPGDLPVADDTGRYIDNLTRLP